MQYFRLLLFLLSLSLTACSGAGAQSAPRTPAINTSAAPGSGAAQRPHTTETESILGSSNPITVENLAAGSTKWRLPWPGMRVSDDSHLQIKGYPGVENVTPGSDVPLKITVTPAQTFTIDVLRLGDYHGTGGRLMQHLGPFPGLPQPSCTIDASTRMNYCAWRTTVTVHVASGWISGVYVAVLTNSAGYQSLLPFWVIEPNRRSDILYLSSLATYEAYNDFPFDPSSSMPDLPQTGHNLYANQSAGNSPAFKVSFDRPFSSYHNGVGDGHLYRFEPQLISFLERSGYDVTYGNDVLTDAQPGTLLGHKLIMIGGHAEYQSMANYDALAAARNQRVGLAFITSNAIYWQTRFESMAGVDRRILVCYKARQSDPIADSRFATVRWRDLGRPEQKLMGVQYPPFGYMKADDGQALLPINTTHWSYAGSGIRERVPIPGQLSGYEIDSYDAKIGPPDGTAFTLLAASPFLNSAGAQQTQNSSIYRSTAGNWVWATGSMDWAWALSATGSANQTNVRPCLQKVTRTILGRMLSDATGPSSTPNPLPVPSSTPLQPCQ
ncbi:MAG: hypothetical protein NVSMB64_18270 [Candidatus Velthaea sp.]